MKPSPWNLRQLAPVLLAAGLIVLLCLGLTDRVLAQRLFVSTAYYFLMVTVLCWLGVHLYAARDVRWGTIVGWARENWPGIVIALGVTTMAAVAVEPALRVLSDEANLVGTSKNFFASRSPTFTVSGKYYYGSYWDVDVAIDQRPNLFPFLVSLVHAALGYAYDNVFVFNLMVLPVFLLVSYRLAKALGGETQGIVASLLVVAHPIVLISVRSGGFDFFTAFLGLLVLKSLLDFLRGKRPEQLAMLWLNLCVFAGARYESVLFVPVIVGLLLVFRAVSWRKLRPFALIYALTPAFLLPRIWLWFLRGTVPRQDPGTVTFGFGNFFTNLAEYFQPLLEPMRAASVHSSIVIALGAVGGMAGLRWVVQRGRTRGWKSAQTRWAAFVVAWMLLQAIVVFAYVWGRAQYPSSARLVISIDLFFSLAAAWTLVRAFRRWNALAPILVAAGAVAMALPVASQSRMMSRLTQTRESDVTWRFFAQLPDRRILIVTDRPNHFTIMGYGAMSFENARRDAHLFTALERRLFQDVYAIQQIRLSSKEPLPGYELWIDRQVETVLEFQNDADVLVRVVRFVR